MGFVGCPGQAGRYVSGLCVTALGLCAAGWPALAPVAFGYRGADRAGVSLHRAAWADWATAAALALVSLLTPLLPESPEPSVPSGPAEPPEPAESAERAGLDENHRPGASAVPHPRSGGLAAIESMLAGAELLMVGCGEEEAW
jgi:hypothetical protein